MLRSLIAFVVHRRLVALCATLIIAIYGVYSYLHTAIEAYPDVTNVQVGVIAQAPGLAPEEVERQIIAIPEFTECDKVTGEDCFIARLHVRSMEQLDTLLDRLNTLAETNTAIVKKTPVKRRLPPMA